MPYIPRWLQPKIYSTERDCKRCGMKFIPKKNLNKRCIMYASLRYCNLCGHKDYKENWYKKRKQSCIDCGCVFVPSKFIPKHCAPCKDCGAIFKIKRRPSHQVWEGLCNLCYLKLYPRTRKVSETKLAYLSKKRQEIIRALEGLSMTEKRAKKAVSKYKINLDTKSDEKKVEKLREKLKAVNEEHSRLLTLKFEQSRIPAGTGGLGKLLILGKNLPVIEKEQIVQLPIQLPAQNIQARQSQRCSEPGCDLIVYANRQCEAHYQRGYQKIAMKNTRRFESRKLRIEKRTQPIRRPDALLE